MFLLDGFRSNPEPTIESSTDLMGAVQSTPVIQQVRTYIYALLCPDTFQIRYVGKSANPVQRLRAHMRQGRNAALRSWLSDLKATSQKPILRILEELQRTDSWQERERHWIGFYRSNGVNLLNLTAGGNGFSAHTDESRKKIARALTGDHNPMKRPEAAAKVSARRRGVKLSPEWRAAMSAARMGKKYSLGYHHSDEARARMSAARMGNKNALGYHHSDEARARISMAQTGKKRSPETRAKMSAAAKRRWANPNQRIVQLPTPS